MSICKINREYLKKLSIITVTSVLLIVLLISCASVPKKPDWVTNYPANPAFYTGIGSSNTGNEAEDSEIARKRAQSNLAAEISAVIMSEVNYRQMEDSRGNAESQAVEEITQLVEQNLKAVETVDSWYSPDSGYWYYMRLNKSEWLRIQQKEMADIERRVKNLVEPVMSNNSRTIAEILPVLADGWDIVAESAYAGMIESELGGEQGVLLDLLEKQIAMYIGSLTISFNNENVSAQSGRPVSLDFAVSSQKPNPPGQLQIDLVSRNDSKLMMSCTTPSNGKYGDAVDISGLGVGKNYLSAVLNTDALGLGGGRFQLNLPKRDFLVDVQKIKSLLNISYTGDIEDMENTNSVYGTVKAAVSDTLPLEIISSGSPEFVVNFTLNYRNAPPNNYGFTIIYVKANISIIRRGNNIFTYETAEVKGAGLDWEQANTKALDKLFEELELDSDYSSKAAGAFTVD